MDGEQFKLLFLGLFGLGLFIEVGLNILNRNEIKKHRTLPPSLAGLGPASDPETFAKSRAYNLATLSFDSFSLIFSSSFTLVLLFSGVLPWLDGLLFAELGSSLHRSVVFIVLVILIPSLVKLPLSIYSTFRIEGQYGFNTMTWALYGSDLVKQFMMTFLVGIPLLYGMFYFMTFAGPTWWLYVFGLILAFQISMMILYPSFIAPFFNRFQPLPEGDLKSQIMDLAKTLKFSATDIFVMDGSRRSLHSNAYFTGIGSWRRIVLFDTLISQMENKEMLGILAHEIGHYKLKHIYKLMAVQILMLGIMLFIASKAFAWAPLYHAFGFTPENVSPATSLFLFLTVYSSLSIFFSPLQNLTSRRHEYQADAFAAKSTGDAASLRSALAKLSQKNLSNLTPHPWYSRFHYSHPALQERLKALF